MDSGLRSFVSESEVEEIKRKRQEEWDRVRQPDEPLIAPEPEIDNRSLYDRLKEQRDKKDNEYEEAHKLKNLFRGLDNEEVDYLDQVDNFREAEDRKRENEVRELLSECEKASSEEILLRSTIALQQEASLSSKPKDSASSSKPVSKQAKLLAGAIKRKSNSMDQQDAPTKKAKDAPTTAETIDQQSVKVDESKNGKIDRNCKIVVPVAYRPSVMQKVAILPGLTGYEENSSSGSDDSSSSEDEFAYSFPVIPQDNDAGIASGTSKSRRSANATSTQCAREN